MVGIVVRFGEESLKLGGHFYLPLKAAFGGHKNTFLLNKKDAGTTQKCCRYGIWIWTKIGKQYNHEALLGNNLSYTFGRKDSITVEAWNKNGAHMKVCLVGSSGGHLSHLYMLRPFWQKHERFWVTFDKDDAKSLLKGEKMYPCHFPTNRSIKALFKNTKLAFNILKTERPDLIVSSGAAVAVPFFYIGKLFGAKSVFVEVFDRIDKPTVTGRIVYPITDAFIVEWEEMKRIYPKAVNLGSIF